MPIAAPFVSASMDIEKDWIDYNGHLNMAYYNVLFDRCSDDAFEAMGMGPDYARERKLTIYTAEVHVCYVQELHLGDKVTVTFQLSTTTTSGCAPTRKSAMSTAGSPRPPKRCRCMSTCPGRRWRPSPPMCWPRSKRCAPPMPRCRCPSAPAVRSASAARPLERGSDRTLTLPRSLT